MLIFTVRKYQLIKSAQKIDKRPKVHTIGVLILSQYLFINLFIGSREMYPFYIFKDDIQDDISLLLKKKNR